MPCTIKVTKHANERMIERGIPVEEVEEGIERGPRIRTDQLRGNWEKHYIQYKYFIIIFVCKPCYRNVVTVHYP